MAGIKDMVIGKKYLAGDSYGYDKVECIAINPKETPEGCYGVKVRYLDTGFEDLYYENETGCMFSTYVEEIE